MAIVRGLVLAVGAFLASFVLHIVAGAAGLGWLFAIAVVLIFLTATGLPAIALLLSRASRGSPSAGVILAAGGLAGTFFTAAALWAANGRSFAWWEVPAAIALVSAATTAVLALARVAVPHPAPAIPSRRPNP